MELGRIAALWTVGMGLALGAAAGGEDLRDWGDAPDDQPVCQAAIVSPSSDYPTQLGTTNALAGRTAPSHDTSAVSANSNFYFAAPPTEEEPAFEAQCDWLSGLSDNICDEDNAALVLCLDAPCTTGVFFGGADPDCDELGAAPFGVTPTTTGYYVYEVTRESSSTQAAYVNIAVDFGLSSRWGDSVGEWVVGDLPLAAPGWASQVLVTPAFPITTLVIPCAPNPLGWCIDPFWTRFLVSTELIGGNLPPSTTWDGSGQAGGYVEGETEDLLPATDPATVPLDPPVTWQHPTNGMIAITLDPANVNCNTPTVVSLTSTSLPTEVRRLGPKTYTTGETVPIEIVAMELTGNGGPLGPVTVREPSNRLSFGLLSNVQASGGNLLAGESFFDIFVEVDLPDLGQIVRNPQPANLFAGTVTTFPTLGTTHHLRLPGAQRGIPLVNVSQQPAGFICDLQITPLAPLVEIIFRDNLESAHLLAWHDSLP